jgi:hypothetical protein
MIPTRSKAKLPKALSYPLGAAMISEALAGAPHADELHLAFSDHPVWPASKFQRVLREGLPYRVTSAWFIPAAGPGYSRPHTLTAAGWYDGCWSLTVYPVLRELRAAVGRLLQARGLPAVVEWLQSSERAGWDGRRHELDLVYHPADGTLAPERTDGV